MGFRSPVAAACLVATAFFGAPTPAAPVAAGRPTPEPGACPEGTRGAILETACDLARALGKVPASASVVAGAIAGGRQVIRPVELATRVARTVAAALGPTHVALSGAMSLGEARAKTSSGRELVFVAIEISGGRLRVTADAYTSQSFWDRVRSAAPSSLAHAFSERRLDGEVGSFLTTVPLVSSRVEKATAPNDIVALACGDLDGDGSLELVVAGRRRIDKGRIVSGHFVSAADVAWAALTPVAPSPLREPIASIVLAPARHVDVGLTDRRAGIRLEPELRKLGELAEVVPWFGVGCLGRAGVALATARPCFATDPSSTIAANVADVDAVSGTGVVSRDGVAHTVVAYRERATATAVLMDDTGRSVRIPGAGGQLALGDLDLDGAPELVSSSDTRAPSSDVLTVRSWGTDGVVRERFRLAVPDGIRALATCPSEDARAAPIVVATGSGLWIVR